MLARTLFCALALSACTADLPAPDECGTPVSPDAWVGGEPPRFEELWQAGGTNEGEELSLPYFASPGPGGRLAITDIQLHVIGIEEDGSWMGPLTHSGDGPGEVGFPVASAWTRDGHLRVLDMNGPKVVTLDPSERAPAGLIDESLLDPVGVAPIVQSGQIAAVGFAPSGTAYLQANEPLGGFEVAQQLVRFVPGVAVDSILTVTSPSLGGEWRPARTMVAPAVPRLVFAVGADGRLATAGHSPGYEIMVSHPDGRLQAICRTVTALPIQPYELGEGVDPDTFAPFLEGIEAAERPEHPFPIGRLSYGRDGRLWVERDRPAVTNPIEYQTGRPGSLFDVFDVDGAYLGEVRAPANARIVAADGDRVWAFETGEFDVTWVVAYRLVRGDG